MNILSELFETIGTILSALAAIALFLAITVAFGYVLGWFFSVLWNNTIAYLAPVPTISPWQGAALLVLVHWIGSAFTSDKKA